MPTYLARARDSQGNARRQKISANTPREARTRLRERGLFVLEIKEAKSQGLRIDINLDFLSGIKVKDKAVFSRQLATLVNAGVAVVRGLGIMAEQCSNPKLKKALTEINRDVQQGSSLSDAMRLHPQAFDRLYVSMVQAGETGGVLDEVLNQLSKLLEDQARLGNQIKSAMTYPAVTAFLAVSVFIGMTVFVLPTFAGIFKQIGADLPAFTKFMLGISSFLRTPHYDVALVLLILALGFFYRRYYKTRAGRETMDRFFLKLPLFGDLFQKTAVARFCRTFGALTRSGVPILTSLEIVRDTAGNQVIANAIDGARREIQRGGMISLALEQNKVFPLLAIQMLSIGEETGEIDKMLMKVADFYEDEVEQTVKALTSIMEPMMIVVVGGMVGAILVSMYLPMFKIFEELG